jgi:hypothetical protein
MRLRCSPRFECGSRVASSVRCRRADLSTGAELNDFQLKYHQHVVSESNATSQLEPTCNSNDRGGLTYGAVEVPIAGRRYDPGPVLAADQTVPAASRRANFCDALLFATHHVRRGLSRRGGHALEKGVRGPPRVRPGVSSSSRGRLGVRSTPDAIPEPSRPGVYGKVGGPHPLSMPTLLSPDPPTELRVIGRGCGRGCRLGWEDVLAEGTSGPA